MRHSNRTFAVTLSLITLLCSGVSAAACSKPSEETKHELPRCEKFGDQTRNNRFFESIGRINTLEATPSTPVSPPSTGKAKEYTSPGEAARAEALINKWLKEYAPRPRKGFASQHSENPALQSYRDAWARQVEQYGNQHFPKAKGKSLYGSLQVHIEVNAKGKLLKAKIIRAAPDARLNAAALKIIRAAAPFAAFSPEVRAEYDILEFVHTLDFAHQESAEP